MRKYLIAVLVHAAIISGCDSKETSASKSSAVPAQASTSAAASTLPGTLEGNLTLDHSNDWGVWATLTVGSATYHLAIPASVFDASGVPDEGGKVRVTIDSKEEQTGMTTYHVSSLQKL